MSTRLLLNLCLLLLVSGALLLLLRPEETTTEAEVQLTDLAPASINRIRIDRRDSDSIHFSKQGESWLMEKPYALPANSARISTMLGLLQAHSYTRLPAEDAELYRFALQDPAVSITFNNTRIDFGDSSPLGETRYVRNDDNIHLVNDSLFQQLQAPASFFLDSRLLPADARITAIHFPEHVLRWQEERWQLTPATEISADRLARIINGWQQAQALSIREYQPAGATDRIRIEFRQQPALEFVIVTPPPQLVLARPDVGLQYHLGRDDAERLFLPATTDPAATAEQ